MVNMNNQLQAWELETNKLTEIFVKKYFKDSNWYWIGKDIGGVIAVADYFFDIDMIREALKYNASSKKLFEYYELTIEIDSSFTTSFKNFIKAK